MGQADGTEKPDMVEGEAPPLGAERVGQFVDSVVKTGDGDAAFGIIKPGVADQGDVGGQLGGVVLQEGDKRGRT